MEKVVAILSIRQAWLARADGEGFYSTIGSGQGQLTDFTSYARNDGE